jgi:hypothetical protein
MMYSMMSGLMEMSTLMVGEMLAIFPYSKALGAGIECLNQSIYPRGMQSLVSTTQLLLLVAGWKAPQGRKND